MNKRERMLQLVNGSGPLDYTPAAFFLHFDAAHHRGRPAIDKHLEYFRATDMDFVKVQYETVQPPFPPVRSAADWAGFPRYPDAYFRDAVEVVAGLVEAVRGEALVIPTVYSPFMWAMQLAGDIDLAAQMRQNPEAVHAGLAAMTDNVVHLVRECKRAGADGFYVSTQGGEAFRLPGTSFFETFIKPTDLAVWAEIGDCRCNILHICDYVAGYDDLSPFLDYPGHIVNCSLHVGDRTWTPVQAAEYFGRPFMGGMERKGVLATGSQATVQQAAEQVLAQAPAHFVLGADCTVPSDTPWSNLRAAIDAAHRHRPAMP